MPAPPPPGSHSSGTGAGEQTAEFTLGHGMFRLLAASISTSNGYAENASINYIYKTGDGTEVTVVLVSGLVKQYLPLILDRDVFLQGPGIIRSKVYHEVSSSHTFNTEYFKLGIEAEMRLITR